MSRSGSRLPFVLLIVGLLVGGLLLLLALNTASAANELRRSSLTAQDQEVSADVSQLQIDVAASAAPGNLARAAEQLGMVPAGHAAFIVELPDGRTVLRGHARAVTEDPLDLPQGTTHAAPKPTTRVAPKSTATAPKSTSSAVKTTPSATKTLARGKKTPTAATKKRTTSTAPPPRPTSTPTPTITIPGGDR